MQPKYVTKINKITGLSEKERERLAPVCDRFAFRANSYYLGLIDWENPDDPIRRIVIPSEAELGDWGALDASGESGYVRVPGLEHKYGDTAILLTTDVCGGFCRFCFRKRLFMEGSQEVARDITPGLDYIRRHREISNVLLTGGDPFFLSTRKIQNILERVFEIEHVRIVRFGTKMPAFNPYRFLEDPELPALLERFCSNGRQVYLMVHFNHPNELTDVAAEALQMLSRSGVALANQTPIIRGVNDRPRTLARLFNELAFAGAPPYYVFQCRPTLGNLDYSAPIEEGFEIFQEAQSRCSGLAKRARFVMSHASGKIEVIGKSDSHVFVKYHRAADLENCGRMMVLESNPEARWLDDYSGVFSADEVFSSALEPTGSE